MSGTHKIDDLATVGLLGVHNSLAYRMNEVERHLHSYQRAYGLAAAPAGTTHRADEITSNPEPFVIDAGNNDWGTAVCIFGSTDTPAAWAYLDPHKIAITAAQVANITYLIQIIAGTSAAAGLTAGTFSDLVFTPQSANGRPAAIEIGMERQAPGTLLWARNLARGTDTATLSFYMKMHGYEG